MTFNNFTCTLLSVESLAFGAILVLIGILIIRRIRIKQNEDFEEREN